MNIQRNATLSSMIAAILVASAAMADAPRPLEPVIHQPAPRKPGKGPQVPQHAAPVAPNLDLGEQATTPNAGFGTTSAFTAAATVSPDTTIAAPATITTAGSATALTITDSGTGRGMLSNVTNSASANSAIFGQTVGKSAAITGKSTGTGAPGGTFQVANTSSAQAAAFATTNGSGPAILATTANPDTNYPVIYGYNTVSADIGVGVEGQGGYVGVMGVSGGDGGSGVMGTGTYGVSGNSDSGDGVYGFSFTGSGVYGQGDDFVGVYGFSVTGDGMQAWTESGNHALYADNIGTGYGIYATSNGGTAIYGTSATGGYGVRGASTNAFALIGQDAGSGIGVYGSSGTGWAGYFAGPIAATSYSTSSDRNAKTDFKPIDGKDILERVSRLPVTSWDFKKDLTKRHVGPMAQDFHAEFGLNGEDDKTINLTDIAGVSIAAIQELDKEMKQKDAQIAELTAQLSAQSKAMADVKSMAEVMATRMTVLERQHEVTAQNVAVSSAGPGAAE